jgi:hypothetical protein
MSARPSTASLGHRRWAIAGGHIPLQTRGPEPEYTSFERICLLNAGDENAEIELAIHYSDGEPVGPYRLCVPAQRVRHVRFNDLIDPLAMPLDVDYAVVVTSNVPIVVQFSRQDTGAPTNATMGTLAWSS